MLFDKLLDTINISITITKLYFHMIHNHIIYMYENIIYLSIYSLFNIKTLIKIISLLLQSH